MCHVLLAYNDYNCNKCWQNCKFMTTVEKWEAINNLISFSLNLQRKEISVISKAQLCCILMPARYFIIVFHLLMGSNFSAFPKFSPVKWKGWQIKASLVISNKTRSNKVSFDNLLLKRVMLKSVNVAVWIFCQKPISVIIQ